MSWLLFLPCIVLSAAAVTHEIGWNSTNSVFDTFEGAIDSPGYYEILASSSDNIKFICPKRRSKEYLVIYQVSHDDFMHCTASPDAYTVGVCDSHTSHYTFPLMRGVEQELYFISTSTGTMAGLHLRRMGLCLEKNLRLAVSLGLTETLPLRDMLRELDLESKGLNDSTLYLIEENGEVHWKKNVHPRRDDLNEEIKKSRKYDKTKQIEPVPISNEFIIEKLEEMQVSEKMYIYPRRHFPGNVSVIQSAGALSILISFLFSFVV